MTEATLQTLLTTVEATDLLSEGIETELAVPVRFDDALGLTTVSLADIAQHGAADDPSELAIPLSLRGRFHARYHPRSDVLAWMGVPPRILFVTGDARCVRLARFSEAAGDDGPRLAYVRVSQPLAEALVYDRDTCIELRHSERGWRIQVFEFADAPTYSVVAQWLETECVNDDLRASLRDGLEDRPWSRLVTAALLIATQPCTLPPRHSAGAGWMTKWRPAAPSAFAWFADRSSTSTARLLRRAVARAQEQSRELSAESTSSTVGDSFASWQHHRRTRAELGALAAVAGMLGHSEAGDIDRLTRSLDASVHAMADRPLGFDAPMDAVLAACWPMAPGAWWTDVG